jgi:hypothetical protein
MARWPLLSKVVERMHLAKVWHLHMAKQTTYLHARRIVVPWNACIDGTICIIFRHLVTTGLSLTLLSALEIPSPRCRALSHQKARQHTRTYIQNHTQCTTRKCLAGGAWLRQRAHLQPAPAQETPWKQPNPSSANIPSFCQRPGQANSHTRHRRGTSRPSASACTIPSHKRAPKAALAYSGA